MLQTVQAEVDVNGTVRLLSPIKVTRTTRAVLTLLDDNEASNLLPPEVTAPEERALMVQEIIARMQANPIPATAPRFTREELHERG